MKSELYLKRLQLLFYIFFATGMIGLAIYGGYKNFHSLPFWDSWGGNLNFYIKFMDGNYSELWSLHNEHRIIISKILFIIDNYFFGGLSIFLIIVNYLFIIFALILFIFMVKNIVDKRDYEKNIVILLISGFLFSWTQYENMTWSFQGLFFFSSKLTFTLFNNISILFYHRKKLFILFSIIFWCNVCRDYGKWFDNTTFSYLLCINKRKK